MCRKAEHHWSIDTGFRSTRGAPRPSGLEPSNLLPNDSDKALLSQALLVGDTGQEALVPADHKKK